MRASNNKPVAIKIIIMFIVLLIVLLVGYLIGKYKFKNKPFRAIANCDLYKLRNHDVLIILFNRSGGIQEFSIWDSEIKNLKAEQAFLENGTTRLLFRRTSKEKVYIFLNPDGSLFRKKTINIQTESTVREHRVPVDNKD